MMSWQGANLSFWLITILVVVSGAFAAFSRNLVRAAFSLFFTLFGMAGYYVLLGSDFIAVTQVIIYVGGILVLLMFGILLTNRISSPVEKVSKKGLFAGYFTGGVLLLLILVPIIFGADWKMADVAGQPASSLRELGKMLLGDYVLALEISGMSLLLCLVGAAYLVRRREG